MAFDWIEAGVLAACPLPRTEADIQSLHDQGIRAIITLTERPLPVRPGLLTELGIAALHIPVDDFGAPTIDQIDAVVTFIDAMEQQQKPVLIHCWAGQGRTGTFLHAYFLAKGWSLADARRRVSARRPLCDFTNLSAVQQTFLEDFAHSGRTLHL